MRITVIGRKVNLRENFKELTQKKLSRFERIFDEDAEATVVVTVERKNSDSRNHHPSERNDL